MLLLSMGILYPQNLEIRGRVVDAETREPLVGVSVFFDGTSIGTVTDMNGQFVLASRLRMTAPVIIQYLGYETRVLYEPEADMGVLLLSPQPVELEEVVLEPDTWSRRKKERVFLKEFLGDSPIGRRCEIRNLETVRMYYSASQNSLQAFPSEPLIIVNRTLGYILTYDLQSFKAVFDPWSEDDLGTLSVTFAGLVRFSAMEEDPRKYDRNRLKAYRGSILHFMRALRDDNLLNEDFGLYFKSLPTARDKVLQLLPNENGLTEVVLRKNTIDILYDRKDQSFMQKNDDRFYIDGYGNYGPTNSILFGGTIGSQRVGRMLPLDYRPDMDSQAQKS